MTALLAVLATVLGLAIGSFLSVVVHRVPRGQSVVRPRSSCPGCETEVRSRDNVPVVSWLLLRGRCRDCGARISVRYPLLELVTAGLFAGIVLRLAQHRHGGAVAASYLVLTAVMVALALIDLETFRLPDVLTLPLYGTGLLLLVLPSALAGDRHGALRAVEGGAVVYAAYFVICFATAGRGLGFGDVKLAGPIGMHLAWLGWPTLGVGLLATHVLAGVVAAALVLKGKAARRTRVPFGPFLVLGCFIGIFAGSPLGRIWLG